MSIPTRPPGFRVSVSKLSQSTSGAQSLTPRRLLLPRRRHGSDDCGRLGPSCSRLARAISGPLIPVTSGLSGTLRTSHSAGQATWKPESYRFPKLIVQMPRSDLQQDGGLVRGGPTTSPPWLSGTRATNSGTASRRPASRARRRWRGRLFTRLLYFRAVHTEQAFEKWSGRRDLNPRPLDPQSRMACLARSERAGRGASHLQQRPEGVAGSLSESTCIGSRSWLPIAPSGGRGATYGNQDQQQRRYGNQPR